MHTVGLVLLLISPVCALQAQLAEQDTARWSGQLNQSFFLSQGNIDRLLYKADGQVRLAGNQLGFSQDASYLYGTFGPFQTENDLLVRSFGYWQPRKRVYPYVMVWAETVFRRRIDFRYVAGPGITWVALRKPGHVLKASATAGYEYADYLNDRLRNLENPTEVVTVYRAIFRLFGQHQLPGKLRLSYEGWYQMGLDLPNHYRMFGQVGLQLPVTRTLSFRTDLSYQYEHVVVRGFDQEDNYLTVGMSWKPQPKPRAPSKP